MSARQRLQAPELFRVTLKFLARSITADYIPIMLRWYMFLDARGKLFFWGTFGLLVNGVIYFLGVWMPVLLFVSIGMLFLAFLMKSEDSTDI